MLVELSVFLKGPILLFDIVTLIADKIEKQLEAEGADNGNLVEPLCLPKPFFDIQVVEIFHRKPSATAEPTDGAVPSSAPTDQMLYDPTSEEECLAIFLNQTVNGQEDFEQSNVGISL